MYHSWINKYGLKIAQFLNFKFHANIEITWDARFSCSLITYYLRIDLIAHVLLKHDLSIHIGLPNNSMVRFRSATHRLMSSHFINGILDDKRNNTRSSIRCINKSFETFDWRIFSLLYESLTSSVKLNWKVNTHPISGICLK